MTTNGSSPPPRPAELLTQLHDEALQSLEAALGAMDEGRIEAKFAGLAHATEVVNGLHDLMLQAPDMAGAEEAGGVYRRCLALLVKLNCADDPAAAREIAGHLRPLRNAWADLDRRLQGQSAAPQKSAA